MVESVFRPWVYLGKNSEKHSLKTERSWTHQYHQAGKKSNKTLKDLVPYFTKYSKSVLRNILMNSQDIKAPALSFSDLETELQTGPEEPMRGCLTSWLLFSVSSFWSQQAPSEGGTSAHVTAVLQTRREVNQPKSHNARRDLQGLTPPARSRLGLGGYT